MNHYKKSFSCEMSDVTFDNIQSGLHNIQDPYGDEFVKEEIEEEERRRDQELREIAKNKFNDVMVDDDDDDEEGEENDFQDRSLEQSRFESVSEDDDCVYNSCFSSEFDGNFYGFPVHRQNQKLAEEYIKKAISVVWQDACSSLFHDGMLNKCASHFNEIASLKCQLLLEKQAKKEAMRKLQNMEIVMCRVSSLYTKYLTYLQKKHNKILKSLASCHQDEVEKLQLEITKLKQQSDFERLKRISPVTAVDNQKAVNLTDFKSYFQIENKCIFLHLYLELLRENLNLAYKMTYLWYKLHFLEMPLIKNHKVKN